MLKKIKKKIQYYTSGFRNLTVKSSGIRNKQILVIQNTGLGDACQLIPFVRQLKADKYTIEVLAPYSQKLLWVSFVNPKRYYPLDEENMLAEDDFISLKSRDYEVIFVASMNPTAAWLSTVPKAKNRLGMIEGYKYYRGSRFFYTEAIRVDKHMHVADRYWELIRAYFPHFTLKDLHLHDVSAIQNKIVIHPGGKWKPRRWMAERYWKLAQKLAKTEKEIYFLVHPKETDLADFFKRQQKSNGIHIVYAETIQKLIEEIKSCAYFVGNDSGPVHLANLLNKPLSVIWGPGDLKRIRPLGENVQIIMKEIDCRPCKQYKDPERCARGANECLQKITVREVYDLVMKHQEKLQ